MTIKPGQIDHERYQFERIIGQGAFGVTWLGQHLVLHRPVAIKVIEAGQLDPSNLERVMRECQIGGQLRNAHIVDVLDAYKKENTLSIVMEYLAGGSLKDYLSRQQPTLAQGLQWAVNLAGALAAVHEHGIIHRDIKPANILLTEEHQLKIADFGIAHLPGSQLTQIQPGTPAYRAPEQTDNQPVDAAADVYALSAVLFEMFTGEKFTPFKGVTQAEWPDELQRRLARRYFETGEFLLDNLAALLVGGLAPDPANRTPLSKLQQGLATIRASLPGAATGQRHKLAQPTLPPESTPGQSPKDQTPLSRIGRYELQALIGQGGMGSVYKAYDPHIDRSVALKTITIVDPSWRARFQREVRIAGRLNHPHIVTVFDVGETGQVAYIVMELIEGKTLANLLPSRLPWPEAIELLLPICRALEYAHQQGVIHRDVKPANILLTADGRVKLTDFGVARLDSTQQLTNTGAVIGTLLYMAPEQLAGKSVDLRADIYALGVILFELIVGQNPFLTSDGERAFNRLHRAGSPDFSLLADLAPLPLQDLVQRTMADAPTDRFATAADLAAALTAHLKNAPENQEAPADKTITVEIGLPPVEADSGLALSTAERELLATAFSGHDRLYIEGELSRPAPTSHTTEDEGSRLLVALPVRSGLSLARVILKLASPEILSREWKAYQEHVAGVLPLVTAHIQGAPLLSADRRLALLRYTFAGDVGDHQAVSLAKYYQTHPGSQVATLIERNIFQVVARNWWLDRATHRFLLGQVYDHLLPVHLVIEKAAPETDPPVLTLKAGSTSVREIRNLQTGRAVQIQGFRVRTVQAKLEQIILETRPASGSHTERLRLCLTNLAPAELRYQPDDLAPNFAGTIVATRHQLLTQAAETAFPRVDLSGSTVAIGSAQMPNPLTLYEQFLERPVMGMRSIIHGHLTLENILVEPNSGLTWLIDFADTRQDHNLYDFVQLEAEIITRILPAVVKEASLDLSDAVSGMARVLHTTDPPATTTNPVLQKPYELLRVIRQLAGQCMLEPDRWDEYYLGLVMMLLGALPAFQTDPTATRLAFAWAAVASELVDQPLRPPPVAPPAKTEPSLAKYALPTLAGAILIVGGAILWLTGGEPTLLGAANTPTPTPTVTSPPPPPATSTASPTPSPAPSATPSATQTPTLPPPTATPTAIPGPANGSLAADLPVYSGPATTYTPLGNITEGTPVQVVGRNLNGDWRQIVWPGGNGWVDANFVEIEETANLPVINPSPPPPFTSTPTATSTFVPPTPTITNTPTPSGTPTAGPDAPRMLVNDTTGYQVLDHQAMGPNDPSSAAFSPDGSMVAATEGIRMYTINQDGSAPHIWMEEDDLIRPVEGIVWSPNGQYFAFVADRKRDCTPPCRRIAIAILATQQIFFLEPPEDQSIGLPRWLQDGRLMVTIYPIDPANGVTYVYETTGVGQPAAAGTEYILSSNYRGQAWHPWQSGRRWQANPAEPHRYYND